MVTAAIAGGGTWRRHGPIGDGEVTGGDRENECKEGASEVGDKVKYEGKDRSKIRGTGESEW